MWVGSELNPLCTLANEEPHTLVDTAPLALGVPGEVLQ